LAGSTLRAATPGIEEMAHETATSPAAVNRLAKALNLSGYTGMKAELAAHLACMSKSRAPPATSPRRRPTTMKMPLKRSSPA